MYSFPGLDFLTWARRFASRYCSSAASPIAHDVFIWLCKSLGRFSNWSRLVATFHRFPNLTISRFFCFQSTLMAFHNSLFSSIMRSNFKSENSSRCSRQCFRLNVCSSILIKQKITFESGGKSFRNFFMSEMTSFSRSFNIPKSSIRMKLWKWVEIHVCPKASFLRIFSIFSCKFMISSILFTWAWRVSYEFHFDVNMTAIAGLEDGLKEILLWE